AGATVQFAFDGSGVSWLAQRSNQTGPAEVYVDGVDEGTVTPVTSAPPYPVQQVDYSITGLVPGDHTLEIVNSTSALITVDAFSVENGRQVMNDDGAAVTYSGSGWTYSNSPGSGNYDQDTHTSSSAGATVTYAFNGTAVSWLAPRTATSGPVEVYVDGVDEGSVTPPTGSAPYPAQQVDYAITGLAGGYHTLRLVNTTAAPLTVDAFTSRW
ncbi:MAG TPA: hypothetical protein VG142_18390, partial [Trebonia sp.]|nr:hypothetical protein [Trebonia sp.]